MLLCASPAKKSVGDKGYDMGPSAAKGVPCSLPLRRCLTGGVVVDIMPLPVPTVLLEGSLLPTCIRCKTVNGGLVGFSTSYCCLGHDCSVLSMQLPAGLLLEGSLLPTCTFGGFQSVTGISCSYLCCCSRIGYYALDMNTREPNTSSSDPALSVVQHV